MLLDMERPPTAVFCANDLIALGALETARLRGYRVPQDISVVGFDDIDDAERAFPPLTTIQQPPRRLGVVAAETIAGAETLPLGDYRMMPRATFCQPQVASFGLTEEQATCG